MLPAPTEGRLMLALMGSTRVPCGRALLILSIGAGRVSLLRVSRARWLT
jgi:hypothetical protein